MLSDAVSLGRRQGLIELRDVLARAIDDAPAARDLAALSLRLVDVLAEIDAIDKAAPAAKGTPLDELNARRAARVAGSAGSAHA